ncbi:NACHT domain-containing NTPase [uncultured Tistrella sp.]|uniref:NACHT domain-containing protein n=1 Tax=Tistrella mobilis TaxID=171437 RepID=UPI002627E4B4|nr:hypothetical protein [uncultured Tistrella sp.]
MSDDLNIGKVGAEFAMSVAKEFSSALLQKFSRNMSYLRDKHFFDFEKRLSDVYAKNMSVKIITSRDLPVNFEKIYVSTNFICNHKEYSGRKILELVCARKRIVVSGNGGAGKTFLMRKLWLDLFKNQEDIPIIIELRKINTLSSYNIMDFIRLNSFGADGINEDAFEAFCREGIFIFIFDGFDEILLEKRADLERQIIDISEKYKKCGLVISGRPDDRFYSWNEFYHFRSVNLTYEQFLELIEKVPFDNDIRKNFQRIAKRDFFDKHGEFLSNPLLALMMLLTYRDNAEIPNKLSIFYENCFATLYAQHDSLKESFNREKYMDQLKFKRLFSAFCLTTYVREKYSMMEHEFLFYLEKAKKISSIEINNANIIQDVFESANLMIKDGIYISFIHRSFQEFFAAYYVTYVMTSRFEEVLEIFANRSYDNAFRLAYELHPSLVEDCFLIPKFDKLVSKKSMIKTKQLSKLFPALASINLKIICNLRLVKSKRAFPYDLHSFTVDVDPDHEHLTGGYRKSLANAKERVLLSAWDDNLIKEVIKVFSGNVFREHNNDDHEIESITIEYHENDIRIDISEGIPDKFHAHINANLRGRFMKIGENAELDLIRVNRAMHENLSRIKSEKNAKNNIISDIIL